MIIRIEKHTDNYVVMDKRFLNRTDLSWKAKGLLSYLLSLPNNWDICFKELKTRSSDNDTSLRSGLNELIDFGYIENKGKEKNEYGEFVKQIYVVYELPQMGTPGIETPDVGNPDVENLSVENLSVENPAIINNNINNNHINNKELDKSNSSFSPISSSSELTPERELLTPSSHNQQPKEKKRRGTKLEDFTEEKTPIEWNLCKLLMEKIKENDDHYRKSYDNEKKLISTFQKWSKDFDRMLRLDKRSVEEIEELILWLFESEQRKIGYNCLSPGKLRTNWDRYKSNMLKVDPDQKFKKENSDLIVGLVNIYCQLKGLADYVPTSQSKQIYLEGAKYAVKRFTRLGIPRASWLGIVKSCLQEYIANNGMFGEWLFKHSNLWNELIPTFVKEGKQNG